MSLGFIPWLKMCPQKSCAAEKKNYCDLSKEIAPTMDEATVHRTVAYPVLITLDYFDKGYLLFIYSER